MCAIAVATFAFCSFWIYHYIDLEDDDEAFNELEPISILNMERSSMTDE